jgi:hypothetical protein
MKIRVCTGDDWILLIQGIIADFWTPLVSLETVRFLKKIYQGHTYRTAHKEISDKTHPS